MDLNKELSDADIREQISDFSDLVVTMDLAPPTLQLMSWKENGGAHRLFAQPCSCVIAPQVMEVNKQINKSINKQAVAVRICFSSEALLHLCETWSASGGGSAAPGQTGRWQQENHFL